MDKILQSLGLVGAIIFVSAYLPQIAHLLKVKNSTGISIFSLSAWSFGAFLLLTYAIFKHDNIFILLTGLELLSLITVVILSLYYKRKNKEQKADPAKHI